MLPEFITTGDKQELDKMLAFLLHECPSSMIPTHKEVRQWADALDARGPDFASDAKACRDWCDGID